VNSLAKINAEAEAIRSTFGRLTEHEYDRAWATFCQGVAGTGGLLVCWPGCGWMEPLTAADAAELHALGAAAWPRHCGQMMGHRAGRGLPQVPVAGSSRADPKGDSDE
jgi:hypothetical protein